MNLIGVGGSTLAIFGHFWLFFPKILKCSRIIQNRLYITLTFIRSNYSSYLGAIRIILAILNMFVVNSGRSIFRKF